MKKKKCDLKAVCSIKRKNGTLPIPEVPEQDDFLMRFPKSGMRGSEEAVWAMSFFFPCRLPPSLPVIVS